MTDREKVLCNGIIHTASLAAGAVGAGLAQVPGSDNLLLARKPWAGSWPGSLNKWQRGKRQYGKNDRYTTCTM